MKRPILPTGDSGDAAMQAAFEEVVGPAAERFQPDIMLVGRYKGENKPTTTLLHTCLDAVTSRAPPFQMLQRTCQSLRRPAQKWNGQLHTKPSALPQFMGANQRFPSPVGRMRQTISAQVSAGYDAHWRDPLAGLQMRTSTYHTLAAQLRALADRLCGGRLVLLLEGGYGGSRFCLVYDLVSGEMLQ